MEVVASLSQGRAAAAQCGLFTHKSVPVIFEPSCISTNIDCNPSLRFINNRTVAGFNSHRHADWVISNILTYSMADGRLSLSKLLPSSCQCTPLKPETV